MFPGNTYIFSFVFLGDCWCFQASWFIDTMLYIMANKVSKVVLLILSVVYEPSCTRTSDRFDLWCRPRSAQPVDSLHTESLSPCDESLFTALFLFFVFISGIFLQPLVLPGTHEHECSCEMFFMSFPALHLKLQMVSRC